MSGHIWKQIRHGLKPYQRDLDKEKRKNIRIPLHIRFFSLFSKKPKQRYLKAWEKEHRERLKKALKKTSHIVKGVRV